MGRKQKYIDEHFGTLYIFGESKDSLLVDVATEKDDTVLAKADASKIIKQYDKTMDFIYMFNERFPEQFRELFNEMLGSKTLSECDILGCVATSEFIDEFSNKLCELCMLEEVEESEDLSAEDFERLKHEI